MQDKINDRTKQRNENGTRSISLMSYCSTLPMGLGSRVELLQAGLALQREVIEFLESESFMLSLSFSGLFVLDLQTIEDGSSRRLLPLPISAAG